MARFPLPRLAALLAAAASSAFAADAATALADLTYSGSQAALEALDRDLNAAGNDPAKLAALEQRLLAVLRRADATFAARQAAAQRLGIILAVGASKPAAEAYKPLATMLADERDFDLARLALERVPGDVVDGLFVSALGKTAGRTRLGLLDSIARRRIAGAVPALSSLLKDPDEPTAAAAARALGMIASTEAVAALQATPEPSPAPVAAAKLAAASRLPSAAALGVLRELESKARDPIHRAAAFRQSLDADGGTAATGRIAEALGGTDWTFKAVALESLASSRAPNLVATLMEKLTTWDGPTQAAVISALARRGDAAATPAIAAATAQPDAEVRAAAIAALGVLPGTRDTGALLAKIAAGGDPADAKLARQSLARLNGLEVSNAILSGAERGDPDLRAVYLEQLALRNMREGLPLLLKARADASAAVRSAAVTALGDLAPAAEQKAVLDWTIEARDPDEQTRALRSLVNVTLRNPNVAQRGQPIFAVLQTAQPDLALRLLPALGRIGGAPSADAAARLAVRDDARIAEAATTTLTRWPDATALPALATVTEKAATPAARTAARDGIFAYFDRARDPWRPETTALLSRLLAGTKDDAARKRIVGLLRRANERSAVTLADSLKNDPAVGPEAAAAAEVIRANLAGRPKVRVSVNTPAAANILDGKTATRWSVPAGGEEWIEIDFNLSRPMSRVTLDQTGRAAEFPEHYEVFTTDDPAKPGTAVASGTGQRNRTVIDLPAGTRGRYLVIRNTAARDEVPWTICELHVE